MSSGNDLSIDGTRVDFIKTRNAYGNIVLIGKVISSALTADKTITISHASSSTDSLEDIEVEFVSGDNIDEFITKINDKLIEFKLDEVIVAEKTSNNEIKITRSNDLNLPGPRLKVTDDDDILFETTEVSVSKIYNDITITGTVTEPVISKLAISNVILEVGSPIKVVTEQKHNLKDTDTIKIEEINGSSDLNSDLNVNNHSITIEDDTTILINGSSYDSNYNYIDGGLLSIIDNSDEKIRFSVYYADELTTELSVVDILLDVDDNLDDVISELNSNSTLSGKNIEFEKTNDDRFVIKRTNDNHDPNIRLGVSDNISLGVIEKNNLQTTEKVIGDDLVLSEMVDIINNGNIEDVEASIFEGKLRISKSLDTDNPENTRLILSSTDSTTITDSLGITLGTFNAVSTLTEFEVDLMIGDIVSNINNENIDKLTASQDNNQLVITFTGDTLRIGDGTANSILGLNVNNYVLQTEEQINEFDPDNWLKIKDLIDISILIINDISSRTNKATVFNTIDMEIGIDEICPGIDTGDDAEIECNNFHILNNSDYVMIIGSDSTPSIDGIHKVTNIIDGRKFRIDKFIEEKGTNKGKIIPIKRISFSNKNEAEDILESSEYFDLSQAPNLRNGLRLGTKVYVRNYKDGVGATLVLKLDERDKLILEVDQYENAKANNRNIKNAYLLDKNSNDVIIDYEIFDPAKGIIPKIVDREIDIKSDIDIAFYNNTTDINKNLILENYWGDSQTGKVWWNISNAIYVNYDQGDIDYKTRYWGQLLGSSTIDVYEWTKSTVPPSNYEDLVGTLVDGIEISGEPYSIINEFGDKDYYWSEDVVVNLNSGQLETYYYFWVKNKINVPSTNRRFSVLQIANIIRDPETEKIRWIAATGSNSLLVTGLTDITGNVNLMMKIDFHPKDVNDYHQEFILLAENDPKTIIPEWLHISLRDSLVGYSTIVKYAEYNYYDSSVSYVKDDIVTHNNKFFIKSTNNTTTEIPSISNIGNLVDSNWNLLEIVDRYPSGDFGNKRVIGYAVNKLVPNERLHDNVKYGLQTRPAQSWFVSLNDARKAFFLKLNSQLLTVNLIDSGINWIEAFDSKYWSYVDWNENSDVLFDQRLSNRNIDTYEDLIKIDDQKENEIVFVIDNLDSDNVKRKAAYRYVNDKWKLIYKQNATIQINESVWNKSLFAPVQKNIPAGWDMVKWDSHTWDDGLDVFIQTVLDFLYNSLWAGEYSPYYSDLWFFMAKHVLREQDNVDWIIKSSYVKVNWTYPLDQKHSNYIKYKDDELYEYVNNIKPFRTKISDSLIIPEKIESVGLNSNYSLQFRVQTSETNPKSFNLVRTINETEILYQIDDSTKLTLNETVGIEDMELPLTTSVSGTGTGYVWINGERIEVDYDDINYNSETNSYDLTILNRGVSDTIKVIHNENDNIEIENIINIDDSESIDITIGNDGSI